MPLFYPVLHLPIISEEEITLAVKYHWELEVYQLAREGRQRIFKLSKEFPKEEMYSLTD